MGRGVDKKALLERERLEIEYWKTSKHEGPHVFTLQNLVNKLCEARVFLEKLERFESFFLQASVVLEVGGGQGWASALLKKRFPEKVIVVSDISVYALESAREWERIFEVKVNGKLASRCYQLPFKDDSVDLVFCFQSAHHFVAHKESLAEAYRVLRKGGSCLYLHEPSCRRYIYGLARWRVNKKREGVPEDVLLYRKMEKWAGEVGFAQVRAIFDPTLTNRGPGELLYYQVLRRFRFLCSLLPCTVDLVMVK